MKKLIPYLLFIFIWLGFSYPFFFQRKIPAPLDFLVNFYAPWDAYYDFAVKNPALSDVVSQIIPWKTFSAYELKNGRIPIWNPYNLAGTPHLGNWQTQVLYPTTLLFLFLPIKIAWSLHILLQPFLAGLFMILFLRNLRLSIFSSLLGAVVFSYGGFMTAWLEWGTLGHAILYLPLALLAVDKLKVNWKWQTVLFLSLALSWLAGSPQISLYLTVTVSAYYIFRFWNVYRNKFKLLIAILLNCYIVPLLIAAPQILPGIQTYLGSARNLVDGTKWAKAFLIKPYGLLTFLAPDFFGNPVTRNSWSDFSYVEMQGYIGITGLVLAFIGLIGLKRSDLARSDLIRKFAVVMIAICFLLAVDNPISRLVIDLRLPIISSSSPARLIGIISFWLAVLAAKGMDNLKLLIAKNQLKKILFPSAAIGFTLAGMWLWTFISHNPNILVARRNLIWPSFIYFAFLLLIIIRTVLPGKTVLTRKQFLPLASCLLLLAMSDLFHFHHKFIPFSEEKYWYPEVPILKELRSRKERSFGLLDGNLNLPFRIKSISGYDPLVQIEYLRIIDPDKNWKSQIRVTGPDLPKGQPNTINTIGKLGTKWIIESVIHGAQPWDLRLWEYPSQFKLVWQDDKYQIFENMAAISEEPEPIGHLKIKQENMFKIGIIVSAAAIFGMLIYTVKISAYET